MNSYLTISNSYNVREEPNKKIISYALYGINNPLERSRGFYKGIFVNFEFAKIVYPGWIIRVYMPDNEPAEFINRLIQMKEIELFLVNTNVCLRALRYLPNDDPLVSVWLSRDLDSIVTFREKAAVDDWLTNYPDKELHMMADHRAHCWTIAGGMFGKKNNHAETPISLLNFMLNFCNNINPNVYEVDCAIAEQFFYRHNNYIQHFSFGKRLEYSVPFPKHNPMNCTFVGDVVDICYYYNVLEIESKYITCKKKAQQSENQPQ